jgi:hypothetical protein
LWLRARGSDSHSYPCSVPGGRPSGCNWLRRKDIEDGRGRRGRAGRGPGGGAGSGTRRRRRRFGTSCCGSDRPTSSADTREHGRERRPGRSTRSRASDTRTTATSPARSGIMSAVSAFYEFHQRHGVDLGDLLATWQRRGSGGGSWRPLLAHLGSRPERTRRIRLRADKHLPSTLDEGNQTGTGQRRVPAQPAQPCPPTHPRTRRRKPPPARPDRPPTRSTPHRPTRHIEDTVHDTDTLITPQSGGTG